MAFPILYFIDYQTVTAFWITLSVLVAVILLENGRRLDTEPLYTKIAQTLTVIFVIANVLRRFTEYFLPSLQATLAMQFDTLYQLLKLREALGLALLLIIIYGSAISIVRRFQLSDVLNVGSPPDGMWASVGYYIRYLFRLLGSVATIVIVETIVYVYNTFLSTYFLWTIVYITSTAAVMALLVADVIFVQPYLVAVLRNVEPFFAPSLGLALSYALVAIAAMAAGVLLFPLTWIWLPRAAAHAIRDRAFKTILNGAVGILFCIWLAAFTAWIANLIFHFDPAQFVVAGYYTALALVFFPWAMIVSYRSGRLQIQPEAVPPPPA